MNLENAMSAPLLEAAGLDLADAERITYRLEQTFRYDYEEPVESVRQRLVVVPPRRHGDVHRRDHSLDVVGAPARRQVCRTTGGTTVVHFRAERVEASIEFRLAAVLQRVAGGGLPVLPRTALSDPLLLRPTALTAPDAALRDWADELRIPGEPLIETAERLCAAVHDRLTYENGITSTRTTAAQALAGGRGVCQDFSHVMLALCHLLAVPARYVSGHLIGQGGTHAWVEAVVPSGDAAVAVALDPCNGRRGGPGHLTIASGRDYTDVAPTSGTYVGDVPGRLSTTRSLGVIDVAA